MKYYLFLIVLFHSPQLMAQPYLNETSLWKQYFSFGIYPPGIIIIEDIMIQLDGDTIVGSTTYYRVLKTGIGIKYYTQNLDTVFHGPIHEYLDPIREADQFIYAYDREEGNEYLLYDFSAEVGDTLKSGTCKRDSVLSIDTIYLGNIPRKRFHLPYSPSFAEVSTLVEGIGSTFGFYWHPCNVISPLLKLQCYSQDGNYIQFDPNFDCSGLVLADEVIKENKFSIYPNPFTDEIAIHFSGDLHPAVSISIVNLLGTVVFEKQILTPAPVERITLPDLTAGIYVVCLRDKKGVTSNKMLKLSSE